MLSQTQLAIVILISPSSLIRFAQILSYFELKYCTNTYRVFRKNCFATSPCHLHTPWSASVKVLFLNVNLRGCHTFVLQYIKLTRLNKTFNTHTELAYSSWSFSGVQLGGRAGGARPLLHFVLWLSLGL